MTPPPAKVTIGVMGSGSDEHPDLADHLGKLLARLNVNLLTGSGRGVMTSVSRAFTKSDRARGICIGIVPCEDINNRVQPKNGYPNPFVELPIFTHLPYSGDRGKDDLSRNHINILSSTAIVALPGGSGTRSEVELANNYGKPLIVFSSDLSLVAQFPESVQRARDIKEVELFLKDHIK